MKFQNAKRLCRICAFLLAVVMIGQASITTVWGVSDSMGGMLTSLASTLNNDAVSPLADDTGIDIYTVNGKTITLQGNGIYDTPEQPGNAVGDTKYAFRATAALNAYTTLCVAENVSATVTLSSVNSEYLLIQLEKGATLELILSGACGVGTITLGDGASLSISGGSLEHLTAVQVAGDAQNTSVSMNSVSAVSLTGNITAHTISITNVELVGMNSSQICSLGNMVIEDSKIRTSDDGHVHTISVHTDLSVSGSSTVIKADHIGVAPGGSGQVSLAGVGALDANYVGALPGDVVSVAYPEKLEMTMNSAAVQNWDYRITYKDYIDSSYKEVVPGEDTPIAYRVNGNGNVTQINGYHTSDGSYKSSATVPTATGPQRTNYEFRIWSYSAMAEDADNASDKSNEEWLAYDGKEWNSETAEIVSKADPLYGSAAEITSSSGHVTLYAIYVPSSVVVNLHTNTAEDTIFTSFPAYIGAKGVSLLGYLDYPALSIQGQNAQSFADAPSDGNIVSMTDYSVAQDENADGMVDLYAVWTSKNILVEFQIPQMFDGYQYQYQDGNGVWQTINASTLDELNEALKKAIGTHDIYYGGQYGKLPQLNCVKTSEGEGIVYNFVGWYITSSTGSKIMLDENTVVSADTTTSTALDTGSQIVFALFENARYTLTVPSSLGKWQFLDQDQAPIVFENNDDGTMSAYVNSDTIVYMKRSDETTVSAYWRLTNQTTGAFVWPTESPANSDEEYWLLYSFAMPKANVTAVYDEKVRWDTAMGDYTFGTYVFNGRSSYGFQITDRNSGAVLHQFRWIMTNDTTTVYFTSSRETDHQIKLDAATNLYLDGVQLRERGDIVNQLSAFYTSGIYSSSIKTYDYAAMQNIVMDNNPSPSYPYNSTTSYTVRIHLLADSKVFAIGQKSWLNNITNGEGVLQYRSTVILNGNQHSLDIYSLLLHTGNSQIQNCTFNVLTSSDSEKDAQIHWFHFDTSSSTISQCTINGNGRSMFMRHGGNMAGTGNGMTFYITNSTLTNIGDIHVPFLNLSGSTVTAKTILSIGYGFRFSNSVIEADIIGYKGNIHVGYANSASTFENCQITVNNWMSLSRPRIYGGTTLTITNGLHLYESLQVYGNSTITAGSFERFKTLDGGGQTGQHYSGTDNNHFFYIDIYDGAKVTINGNVNLGVNHAPISTPKIQIYGAGTTFKVTGDADIINTLRILDGAAVTINGDLTLHQDLEVDNATLTVTKNLYHVNTGNGDQVYKEVKYDNGSTESLYWSFAFADNAKVSVSGEMGSKTEADYTNVMFSASNENIDVTGDITRDIQVLYTLPDGFVNNSANPANIRVVGNKYSGGAVTLEKPASTVTEGLVLEENCWYSGEQNWTGWSADTVFTNDLTILRLDARVTSYLLKMDYDADSIIKLEYQTQDSNTLEFPAGASATIPIGATVKLTVPVEYASLVCAESYTNGIYAPITLAQTPGETSDQVTIQFPMNDVQVVLHVKKDLTLYLDDGHIHVQEKDGKLGFARYGGTNFIPYSGSLTITQKDPAVSCLNTLYIERNIAAENATVTLQNIVVKSSDVNAVSDTVCFAPGVTATLHIAGENSIRNIRVPQTAHATVIGDEDATIDFVSSAYYSGVHLTTDTARYYAQIGDYYSGSITMIGGTYEALASFNHQGTAASIGGYGTNTAQTIRLERVTFRNNNASQNPLWFCVGNLGTIEIYDSILDLKSPRTAPFKCGSIIVGGQSRIDFQYTDAAYAASAFSGVSSSVVLEGQAIVEDKYVSSPYIFMATSKDQEMILSDDAQYLCYGSLLLKSLTVQNNAILKVEAYQNSDQLARGIVAKTIDILGGEVVCGFLFVSGYYNAQGSGADLITAHASSSLTRAGKLTISGGTVSAVGGQVYVVNQNDNTGTLQNLGGIIGGSRSAEIVISGGTVSASVIGESAYAASLYRRGVYFLLDEQTETTTLNASAGSLEFDFLGGKKASVTLQSDMTVNMKENAKIEGAVILLQDNAQLFMNSDTTIGGEKAQITLKGQSKISGATTRTVSGLGSIIAPEGSLSIEENASAHVALVNLSGGNIVVSTTNHGLSCDYTYNVNAAPHEIGLWVDHGSDPTEASDDPLGTHVGDLAAENITVKGGAYVSAYRLGSNAQITTSGTVTLETNSYIFTFGYGAFGSGSIQVERQDYSHVNGKLQVSVSYDLNLGEGSTERFEDIMPQDVLYNYTPVEGEGTKMPLPVPERKGYRFDGWYYKGYLDGAVQTSVSSNRNAATNLVAKWTPVNIWVNLKDDERNLDKWLSVPYTATSFTPSSYVLNGQISATYKADGSWTSVLGEAIIPANSAHEVDSSLYDQYLLVNGIDYSDGLTAEEKEKLRKIENFATENNLNKNDFQFVILVPNWSAVQHKITFDAGDPTVTQFQYGDKIVPITNAGTGKQEVACYIGVTYAEGIYVNGVRMEGLPVPIRKGYHFIQWTRETGDSLTVENSSTITIDENTSLFRAQYTQKKIRVYLIPSDGQVSGDFTGDVTGLTQDTINEKTVYYFDISFDSKVSVSLPKTQIHGYVHLGWQVNLNDGSYASVDSGTTIHWVSSDLLIPQDFLPNISSSACDDFLILTPTIERATITYELHGGSWTDIVTENKQNEYKYYTKDTDLPTVLYTLSNDGVYSVTQAANPDQNCVVYHGYRFLGWATDEVYQAWITTSAPQPIEEYFKEEKLITKSTVRYAHETYHAIWKACTYKLTLNAWNDPDTVNGWNKTYFESTENGPITVQYSLSSTIPATITVGQSANLPDPTLEQANITYQSDSSSASARKLVGWMFDGSADPVENYYNTDGTANPEYARRIAIAMNQKSIFAGEDIFVLPKDQKDPGDGGTITLYAVYRERSLIFVHVEPNGNRTVELIADYDVSRSGYTAAPEPKDANGNPIQHENYQLSGWYVNSEDPVAARDYTWYGQEVLYPDLSQDGSYVFQEGATVGTFLVSFYQNEVEERGDYDIYVYSYYAPQITIGKVEIYAQAGKDTPAGTDPYIVPDTMKVPVATTGTAQIKYRVDGAGLQNNVCLVEKSIIDQWDRNDTWTVGGQTYQANNTFAIEMKVTTGDSTWIIPLIPCEATSHDAYINAGSKLEFVVYSTGLLRANTESKSDMLGSLGLTITFPTLSHDDEESAAKIAFSAIELVRRAARYELQLNANTPTYEEFGSIDGWETTDAITSQNQVMQRDFYCGDDVSTLPILTLEGYTFEGWQDGDTLLKPGNALIYAPAKDSSSYVAKTLTAKWSINQYNLTIDQGISEHKTLAFYGQDNQAISFEPVQGIYQVPYKTKVQLTTQSGHESNAHPEFIRATLSDGALLPFGADQKFTIPAGDVDLAFNRVKELALNGETVVIADDTYTVGTEQPITWRGDYILAGSPASVTINTSNQPTDHITHDFVLGGMTSGSITVNNTGDPFELVVEGENTIGSLTVGGSDLLLTGETGAYLTVIPDSGAAISGKNVTVSDLAVLVKLTSNQLSGDVETSAFKTTEKLELSKVSLTAICTSPAATYVGTVLDSPTISLTDSTLCADKENDGCPVSATASLIEGSSSITVDKSTVDSIMKIDCPAGTLTVQNKSQVELSGDHASVSAKTISVEGTAAEQGSTLTANASVITGEQTIGVYANVSDSHGRHLDVKSGDIVIDQTQYQQSGRTQTENRPYVLVGNQSENSVSISSARDIYMDGATIGKITCKGTVELTLLSDSSVSGIEGDEATVSITGADNLTLTSSADIVAHELSISNCTIDASGHNVGSVGSEGQGTVGKVSLDNCTIKATTVGALGDHNKSFTLVEGTASAQINGTLVIDHYRLAYEIGTGYDTSALPTVLRSTTTGDSTTVNPNIPGAPSTGSDMTSYFFFWYLKESESVLHPLDNEGMQEVFQTAGLDPILSLDTSHIEWAMDTIPNDSTKTITLYAWMKPKVSSIVTVNRELNEISQGETSVSVDQNSAWTANFTVDGTLMQSSEYKLNLTQSFPQGTMLTLMVMPKEQNHVAKYYYYECNGNETTIQLSAFKEMGGETAPGLLSGTNGEMIADVLQLSADFRSGPIITNAQVELQMLIGSIKLSEGADTSIQYSLTEAAEVSVTMESTGIHVEYAANPASTDRVYLTVQIKPNGVIPYDADFILENVGGERIGHNTWIFELAEAKNGCSSPYAWNVQALTSGEYTITCSVSTAPDGSTNVLGNVLADCVYRYTEDPKTEPALSVTYVSVDGSETISYVLTGGVDHQLTFHSQSNGTVTVTLERETENGFVQDNRVSVSETNGSPYTVTLPSTLDSGVYRLRFSMNEYSDQDDVYFTFIVK